MIKTKYFPLIVLIPIVCWYVLFFIWPLINSVRIGFYEWNILDPSGSPFVGLNNYKELFRDDVFITSLINTLKFVFFRIIIGVSLGLAVALLILNLRVKNLYLGIIFSPYTCSVSAISILFIWLFQPTFGLINFLLKGIGLPPQGFLSDPNQAIYVMTAIDIWQSLGYTVVLYVAGLTEIPTEFLEAAQLDGANSWQIFRRITLPLLSNVTLFILVTTMIGAFQIFDRVAVMTSGGPGTSSYVLSYFIYRYAIFHMRLSYACTAAIIMFLIIFLISIFQIRIFRRSWEY